VLSERVGSSPSARTKDAYDSCFTATASRIVSVLNPPARQTVRRVAFFSAAVVSLCAVTTSCSAAESRDQSVSRTAPHSAGLLSAGELGRVQSLNINRPCETPSAVGADCAAVTADKIAVAAELAPKLKEFPASDSSQEATRVADGIAELAKEWGSLGCRTEWVSECARPAAAVEAQYSALAAYILQLTDGA